MPVFNSSGNAKAFLVCRHIFLRGHKALQRLGLLVVLVLIFLGIGSSAIIYTVEAATDSFALQSVDLDRAVAAITASGNDTEIGTIVVAAEKPVEVRPMPKQESERPVQVVPMPAPVNSETASEVAPETSATVTTVDAAGQEEQSLPDLQQPETLPVGQTQAEQPEQAGVPAEQTIGSADAPTAPPAARKSIRIMGTVEFRSVIKNLPKWERVLGVERTTPTFAGNFARIPENVRPRWEKVKQSLLDKPAMEQAKGVNAFFNQWPYKFDMTVWGLTDYWATPPEFMQRSGDCEDYAISKYYALRSLGIPIEQLRVLVVKDTIRNIGHAILIIYLNDEAYILDNLTNMILSQQKFKHYAPQYSVNEQYLWRHVKPISK